MKVAEHCLWFLALTVVAYAQPGFISIDCGLPQGSDYTDNQTGIYHTSDANFISTGQNREIPASLISSSLKRQYRNFRSFPEGGRHCYTLRPVVKGQKYWVRASFFHGNYDGQAIPQFDLFLGVNMWVSVSLQNASLPAWTDIVTMATMDFIPVCLVDRGSGTPFISTLELRLLKSSMYTSVNESQSLIPLGVYNVGPASLPIVRYPDDPYDRLWTPYTDPTWAFINTSLTVRNIYPGFEPPPAVMETAATPANGRDIFFFNWTARDPNTQFQAYRHFAEFQQPNDNDNGSLPLREFSVCKIDTSENCLVTSTEYLVSTAVYTTVPMTGTGEYSCSFQKTNASILPPILNAFEVHILQPLNRTTTNDQDVSAIMDVRDSYGVKRNWMGDPCVPADYSWQGLNCSYDQSGSSNIISLNLSSSQLTGKIAPAFRDLRWIQSLDLSGNNLTGSVPEFLATLSSLSYLDLARNNLNGSIPSALIEKSKSGSLLLSVDGNPKLCSSGSCNILDRCEPGSCKKRKFVVPVVIAALLIVSIGIISGLTLWKLRRNKQRASAIHEGNTSSEDGSFNLQNRRFSYAEIISMTSNFQRAIGKGGFGVVYHGWKDEGAHVAVKLLSEISQGSKEFETEAQLLMTLHHRNLVQLIGYCAEGNRKALVLEYMYNGNLAKFHLDNSEDSLSWNQRMRIAMDVAQGLEYLHVGCKPAIIHRDIKSTNILLTEHVEAKFADFGIAKIFLNENNSHISTQVKGTVGYLDPEYYISNNLNEKSDVYSFGVVLLEFITGLPAVFQKSDLANISLVEWVCQFLSSGDIASAMDPRLKEDYDINSAWKAFEVAMACTSSKSVQRPNISEVVSELKDCVGIGRGTVGGQTLTSKEFESAGYSSSLFRPQSR